MNITIMDSVAAVVILIDCIKDLSTQPPSLYLDIEGVNLSRNGSIPIIQLYALPKIHIFLIDIHVLQGQAFDTPNELETTLRSVLESNSIPKVFFDVRNDADALFAKYQISMQGVHDVQLLEVAARKFPKTRVAGLARCIENDTPLTAKAKEAWKATKQAGLALFATELGGTYEVFNDRPLRKDIVDYCTQDVVYLLYCGTSTPERSTLWAERVREETIQRLLMSQAAWYDPKGKHKVLSPWANEMKQSQSCRAENRRKIGTKVTKEKHESIAERGAAKVPHRKAEKQQDVRLPIQPPAKGTAAKQQEGTIESKAPGSGLDIQEGSVDTRATTNLPIRDRLSALKPGAMKGLFPTPNAAVFASKWACTTCDREMQQDQMQYHLAGKAHIARSKKAQDARSKSPVRIQNSKTYSKRPQETATAAASSTKTNAKSKNKVQQYEPRHTRGRATNDRRRLPTAPAFRSAGDPYPPDYGFSGFNGSNLPRSFWQVGGSYMEDVNYGICDKECGWCGHCMDGVDI